VDSGDTHLHGRPDDRWLPQPPDPPAATVAFESDVIDVLRRRFIRVGVAMDMLTTFTVIAASSRAKGLGMAVPIAATHRRNGDRSSLGPRRGVAG
jgi:hypothetical protein